MALHCVVCNNISLHSEHIDAERDTKAEREKWTCIVLLQDSFLLVAHGANKTRARAPFIFYFAQREYAGAGELAISGIDARQEKQSLSAHRDYSCIASICEKHFSDNPNALLI